MVRIQLEQLESQVESAAVGALDAEYKVMGMQGSTIYGGPGGTYRSLLEAYNNVRADVQVYTHLQLHYSLKSFVMTRAVAK
jgi:hypothetical protein